MVPPVAVVAIESVVAHLLALVWLVVFGVLRKTQMQCLAAQVVVVSLMLVVEVATDMPEAVVPLVLVAAMALLVAEHTWLVVFGVVALE